MVRHCHSDAPFIGTYPRFSKKSFDLAYALLGLNGLVAFHGLSYKLAL